jgi:hypothetical protein
LHFKIILYNGIFDKDKKNQLTEVAKLLIKSGVVITVEMNKNPKWV